MIVHLKGSKAYADWIESAHKKTFIPKTVIMRIALAMWAKENGLPPPPDL